MESMQRERKLFFLIVFLLITAVIFWLASFTGEQSSSQSGILLNVISSILSVLNINLDPSQLDSLHVFVRKFIGHFALFGLDGIFGFLTFDGWIKWDKVKRILFTVLVGLGIASISELIQLLSPERGPSVTDVLIDLVGFVLGILFVLLIQKIQRVSSLKKKQS